MPPLASLQGHTQARRGAGLGERAALAAFFPLHEFLPAAGKGVLSRLGLMEKWVAPPKTTMTDAEAASAFEAVREFLPEFE